MWLAQILPAAWCWSACLGPLPQHRLTQGIMGALWWWAGLDMAATREWLHHHSLGLVITTQTMTQPQLAHSCVQENSNVQELSKAKFTGDTSHLLLEATDYILEGIKALSPDHRNNLVARIINTLQKEDGGTYWCQYLGGMILGPAHFTSIAQLSS